MGDSNAQQPSDQSPTSYDVIVIGAGISGINTAYRLQSLVPELTFTILEERSSLGGTWDLFKYPGIRSDSDLHTFGFQWRPWPEKLAIADGESIKKYIAESASLYGIDQKIQYGKKLVAANWSSDLQLWQLSIDTAKGGSNDELRSRFLVMGTGFYDYHNPLSTTIRGLQNFKGQVVQPQFWPETLNFANKKIVIIGSGATAVTLLPALAKTASHVTMLQRSPSYVLAVPTSDALDNFAHKWLPEKWARQVIRWKFMVEAYLFSLFCRHWPAAGRWYLRSETTAKLPASIPHDPHFNPRYNPLEHRLGISPDGDFFSALQKGNSIVTGQIKSMTENSIVVESEGGNGSAVEQTIDDVDIIITATGLKIHLAGGALISVDQTPFVPSEKYAWNTAMIEDLPNLVLMIGYTFASWTLGADASAILFCRIFKECAKRGMSCVTPRLTEKERKTLKKMRLLDLSGTYVEKALGQLPMAGNWGPWRARSNYFVDWTYANWGNVRKGLVFQSVKTKRV